MEITGTTKIGDIATLWPVAISVFERYGVDFFHYSDRPLAEALTDTGLSVGDILAEIERAQETRDEAGPEHTEWSTRAPANLADHISETHHGYLAEELPKLGQQLVGILLESGDDYDALYELAGEFDRLRRMIIPHLDEEERSVFPLIRQLGTAGEAPEGSLDAERLRETLDLLEQEHSSVLESMATIRGYASDCGALEEGSTECSHLFESLAAMETDVRRHIDLEREVLLPALRRLAGI